MFFIASNFTSITSHIHSWVLFLLWLRLFILSGVISPLMYSSILGTYWPGEFIFQCPIFFFLFIMFMGFSRQEYWSGLPFPSPMDHILSELSTMTRPSWVALHGMAHSFIELDKVVVHVIRLVSFLRLWSKFLSISVAILMLTCRTFQWIPIGNLGVPLSPSLSNAPILTSASF